MNLDFTGLAARITLAALTILACAATLVIVVGDQRLRQDYLAKRGAELGEITRLNGGRMQRRVEALRQDTVFLARVPPVSGILRAEQSGGFDASERTSERTWRRRLEQIYSAFLEAHPGYVEVSYVGVADGGRDFVRVERTAAGARVAATSGPAREAGGEFFKATAQLGAGEVHTGEIEPAPAKGSGNSGRRVLRAATPIFRADGKLFGMVELTMDGAELIAAATSNVPAKAQTFLAGANGDYLLSPQLTGSAASTRAEGKLTEDFPPLAAVFDRGRGSHQAMAEMPTAFGLQHVVAERVQFDPREPTRFVVLGYALADSVVSEELAPARNQSLGVAAMTTLVLMIFMAFLLRRTFAPLGQISKAAIAIADGDYDVAVPVSNHGEVAALGKAIGFMRNRIREREIDQNQLNDRLEERVAARTADLKAVQETLLLKEGQLAEALRIGSVAYWEYDFADDCFFIDEHFYSVLRSSAPHARSRLVHRVAFMERFLTATAGQIFMDGIRRAMASFGDGEYVSVDLRAKCGDGTIRWLSARFRAEMNRAGDGLRLVGNVQDVDERKHAEAELRLAASVFNNTMEGVIVTDVEANILSVNPAFRDITGYAPEEVVGKKPSMLRSDHHDSEFYRALWAALLRDGRWQGEIWNRRKSGEVFIEHLTINSIPGVDGKPIRYVGVFRDVTELRRKDERIRHLAFHDALTNLPNRALLLDRLEHGIAFAAREDRRLGLMFLDLDRFKTINDTLGHDVGDGLLRQVAERLSSCVRGSDTVARMGGDEFVILLEHALELEDYAGLAGKVISTLARPMLVNEHHIQVSASVGIACFPDDGHDAVELMKNADAAMYSAKASGRGTHRFFQSAMTDRAAHRLELEMELHGAVHNGELELFYQPKVDLRFDTPCGVEALVRWRHPVHGLVPPAEFIPIAEETGLIAELGDWVLAEACRQSADWRSRGIGEIKIAINVSAKQLSQGDLVARMAALMRQYGLGPQSLEVELTESVIMASPEHVISTFRRLHELGVTVAVDDFGTGYSSLAYLRRLPIDVLKIDRSFVMEADGDDENVQIIKTVLALGEALRLTVVGEGVETTRQAELLKSLGCGIAQGFLYSRPVAAAEFEEWLRRRTQARSGFLHVVTS